MHTQFIVFVCCLLVGSTTSTAIDVVSAIKTLRINNGPYTGGYLMAPGGTRLNWYFANLGLLPLVKEFALTPTDLDLYIRRYLDLFVATVDTASWTIPDVEGPQGTSPELRRSDSDDSYTATFLSLAARYYQISGNAQWWNNNLNTMKNLAYHNLAVSMKSNGLTSAFQRDLCSGQANCLGYTMDNSEVYRGLRDFAAVLLSRGDADADYYDSFAGYISNGLCQTLFQTSTMAFLSNDGDAAPGTGFYPGTTCQVFPQAFNVSECGSAKFYAGWAWLNRYSPNWPDLAYDPYPWAILGYVAALRGQTGQAQVQMANIDAMFYGANRGYVTINELGFYQRTKNLLGGKAAI